jgi:hypothetical protein
MIDWRVIIEKLIASSVSSTTMIGFRGEVGIQILCLMTVQKLMMNHKVVSNFVSFKVKDFVKVLLGEKITSEVSTAIENIPDSHVCRPYQFVKQLFSPDVKLLWNAFLSGTAIYCKENEPVADVILPVAVISHLNAHIHESDMTALVIQVKLRNRFVSPGDASDWKNNVLKLQYVNQNSPFIALYVELGAMSDTEKVNTMQTRSYVECSLERNCTFIATKLSRPSDIVSSASPKDSPSELDKSFETLLTSSGEPSTFTNIHLWSRRRMPKMFQRMPYNHRDPTQGLPDIDDEPEVISSQSTSPEVCVSGISPVLPVIPNNEIECSTITRSKRRNTDEPHSPQLAKAQRYDVDR